MAKGEEDVRTRLQRAALELFRECGYDRTTAAEIAARAGVTERTFFRYFPDKREVLFDGEAILRAALTRSIADAPAGEPLLDILFDAFRSVLPALEANRPFSKPRQDVIAGTPALQERELAKTGALSEALSDALQARGAAASRTRLAARIGMAAFVQATISWLDDPEPGLDERLDLAWRELKALFVESDRSTG
ncbi:TetR family transcriptional regulator [Sphingomonas bacterium]|uniref:TetR family transcriptional regulator n=1 Tax=Sphingomonas bacterium TaxID=1895847 RepID=UPI0020C6FA93|nr:TetR family transcriptional regulator [Sphingomonas bacterium]